MRYKIEEELRIRKCFPVADVSLPLLMIQAETTEDLYEWKTALENVLAHAPSAANAMGQSGIFRSYQADSLDIYLDQCMFLLLLGFIHVNFL